MIINQEQYKNREYNLNTNLQQNNMSDKHYHNDYKKLIGLDQSRTASQKLLDRAIRKREQPATIIKVDNQAKKKVKRQHEQDREMKPQQVITKILKVLSNKNMIVKVQKSLDILNKCLNEKQFVDQLLEQTITEIATTLVQNQTLPQGTLNQLIRLCEVQAELLQKLSKIIEQRYAQKLGDMLKKMQLLNGVMQIITDDSFSFNKQLNSLKKTLFQLYQNKKTSTAETQQQNTQLQTYIEQNILQRLFNVPNSHLEWAKTGITNFFKQLIAQYRDNLINSKRVLQQYNKFMSEKKSNAHNTGSYDIMGSNKTNGATYSVVEQFDSANAWCKRQ